LREKRKVAGKEAMIDGFRIEAIFQFSAVRASTPEP
jgi:hypothetical protein